MTSPYDDTLAATQIPDSFARADAVLRSRQLGPVRLIREIGRGGMGVVWLGHDELLDRDVAVKLLLNAVCAPDDPGFVRFLEGACIAAGVRHSGLTTLHHADLVQGTPYLVMDYVDGPTLSELIRATGPLSQAAMMQVLRPVCEALGELHDRDLVHRDIKPANILVNGNGEVFVTDFGLACERTSPGSTFGAHRTAGTPVYMAPEMFDGVVSLRSDVYALGITAFELLTGSRPFRDTPEKLREKPHHGSLPAEALRERDVGPDLIAVLERATHKDAMFRYKSARLFLRALEEATPGDAARHPRADLAHLVALCRATPHDAAADVPASDTPSSYFDRITELAAQKHDHCDSSSEISSLGSATAEIPRPLTSGGQAECQPEDSTNQQADAGITGEMLGVDVPCVACDYNLRGLSLDGRCPECGGFIAASLRPDRLMFGDPLWLAQIARGLLLCRLGFWALLAAPVIFVFSVIWIEELRFSLDTHPSLTRILVALAFCSPLLSGCVLTTKREPGGRSSDPSARRASRLLILASGLSMLMGYAGMSFALLGLGLVCLAWYLRTLALRIPNSKLANHSRIASFTAMTLPLILLAIQILLYSRGGSLGALPDVVFWGTVLWVCGVLVVFGSVVYATRAALVKTIGMCVSHGPSLSGTVRLCDPTRSRPSAEVVVTVRENPLLDLFLQGTPECDLFGSDLRRRQALTNLPQALGDSVLQRLLRLIRTSRFWLDSGLGILITLAVVINMKLFLKRLGMPAPLEGIVFFLVLMAAFWFSIWRNTRRAWQEPLRLKLLEQGVPVCVGCGYCLRGLPLESARCPECGRAFDERVRQLLVKTGASSTALIPEPHETPAMMARRRVRRAMFITGFAMIYIAMTAFVASRVYPPMQAWYWRALIIGIGILGVVLGMIGTRRSSGS